MLSSKANAYNEQWLWDMSMPTRLDNPSSAGINNNINGNAVGCLSDYALHRLYFWVRGVDTKLKLLAKKHYVTCALNVRGSLA
jgi:hypothetical protein